MNNQFRGTPNRNGRTPGKPNRTTAIVKECFTALLEANLEQLQADLISLTPKDRVNAVLQLAGFIIPKMRSVDLEVTEKEKYKPIIVDLNQWR